MHKENIKTVIGIDKGTTDGDETAVCFRNGDDIQLLRGQIAKDFIEKMEEWERGQQKIIELAKLVNQLSDENSRLRYSQYSHQETPILALDDSKIRNLAKEIIEKKNGYLEVMAAAYLQHTKIPIEECELVEQQTLEVVSWHFRRRIPN